MDRCANSAVAQVQVSARRGLKKTAKPNPGVVIPKARAFTSGPRDLAWNQSLGRSARDPSLRLKDGFARDDAIEIFKLSHY